MENPYIGLTVQFLLQDAENPITTAVNLGARFHHMGDTDTAELIWKLAEQEVKTRKDSPQ